MRYFHYVNLKYRIEFTIISIICLKNIFRGAKMPLPPEKKKKKWDEDEEESEENDSDEDFEDEEIGY
jgi:hypothetical protein